MDLTTNRGEAEMALAEFMDSRLDQYMRSAAFRAQLHAEAPGQNSRRLRGICPPTHPHERSGHCYTTHKCRCPKCRVAMTRRQKISRDRRAAASRNQNNEETRTA